jgi:hypothetical protein
MADRRNMRLPKARPVADKTPRWRAERRRIFPKGRCATELPDAPSRRAIPSYFEGRKRDYGVPGAAKNTGNFAWLFGNHIRNDGACNIPRSFPRKRESSS